MPIDPPRIPRLKFGAASYKDIFDYANSLAEWIEASYPIDGNGITVTDSVIGNGRQINADPATAAGAVSIPPFACRKVDDTTIRVYRGSVSTAVGTFTPAGFNPGDNPVFELTVSGDGVIYFSITVDATTGDAVSAQDPNDAATMPTDTATIKYKELGSFSTDAAVLSVQSNEIGDQHFELCGGVDPVWSAG